MVSGKPGINGRSQSERKQQILGAISGHRQILFEASLGGRSKHVTVHTAFAVIAISAGIGATVWPRCKLVSTQLACIDIDTPPLATF